MLTQSNESLGINSNLMVSVPIPDSIDSFLGQFSFPNFSAISNSEVWVVAFTIALVASLETLLCVEATDKLDPHKNVTPTNRELLAQGTGNIISGMIGGLPITQVIVRSSANIQSGGRTKLSAIFHGVLLLSAVILIPKLINNVPLSVLAAILFIVGYKLAKPALFVQMYKMGWKQFLPFVVTVAGIVFTDLLVGISLGLAVGIIVILINKGAILKELDSLPSESLLELDVRKTRYLDNDIVEILEDFALKAKERNIDIKIISERGIVENPPSYIEFFKLRTKTA